MSKTVLVLGGGYGGILTAKSLAKKVKKSKQSDVKIVLIDQNPFHTMLTELHEVAAGRVPEQSIRMDFKEILAGRKIDFVKDRITGINFEKKTLAGEKESYTYDYLVLGTGSRPTFYNTPGVSEHAFTLWSYDDAVRLRGHIRDMFQRAYTETDAQRRRELLTFVVAGAGFTGVEMAGELAEYVPVLCGEFHTDPDEVGIWLVDLIERIIPSIPEKQGRRAARRLEKMGVKIRMKTGVCGLEADGPTLRCTDGEQKKIPARTVIWTAGIEGSEVVSSADLPKKGRGRVETDAFLEVPGRENVYVVGDNIFYLPEGAQSPVPQMVENAENSAHTVAYNILCDLLGQREKRHAYNPKFHGMMVSVGGKYGTAYVGTHKKKFGLPSFLAMLSKHFINIVYFMQVMGFAKCYAYLRHEIFRIENRRSFVGGFFSRNAPNFWVVPLRLFLGLMWVLQFLEKWAKFITDPSHVFLFTIPSSDAATSATTSATQAAAEYGEALPVPDFLVNMMNWMLANIIAPVAPFVQGVMIMAEILIGLALIGGLLTYPAALVSAAMCVLIYLSGMASPDILWYFFASIAVLAGGASTFSLDYYVLPPLKRWWMRRRFVKKWYLYSK